MEVSWRMEEGVERNQYLVQLLLHLHIHYMEGNLQQCICYLGFPLSFHLVHTHRFVAADKFYIEAHFYV